MSDPRPERPPSTISSDLFADFAARLEQTGAAAALAELADALARDEQYHELFDVRLLASRVRLGLPPILTGGLDDLPEPQRGEVEDAYLEACREVGQRFAEAGRLREAWVYLRPVGERERIVPALERYRDDESQREAVLELALYEGLAPRLGVEVVLRQYGVCNAISATEGEWPKLSATDRRAVAGLLVEHLDRELSANVRRAIEARGKTPAPDATLGQLIEAEPDLFANDDYHIDATHLSAVVRLARWLTEPETLRRALELTEYGRRLSPRYQFAGEPPFDPHYESHGRFFAAQLGERVDEALAWFADQAEALAGEPQGPFAAEASIALLTRLGRYAEAVQASARLLQVGVRATGLAPSLLELGALAGDMQVLAEACQRRGDLVGYAAGLVARSQFEQAQ
jgi:hypothetical protein